VWSECACVSSQWRTSGKALTKLKPSTTKAPKGSSRRFTWAFCVAMLRAAVAAALN